MRRRFAPDGAIIVPTMPVLVANPPAGCGQEPATTPIYLPDILASASAVRPVPHTDDLPCRSLLVLRQPLRLPRFLHAVLGSDLLRLSSGQVGCDIHQLDRINGIASACLPWKDQCIGQVYVVFMESGSLSFLE